MLQALINLFAGKKKEETAECPYKIEAPAVTEQKAEETPKAAKPAKPAKITSAKKPAVKAKSARNKKK